MTGFDTVWAEINLDNIKENLNVVKKHVASTVKILAVVKADAYGHGMCQVARKLSEEGVNYFGVASIDEGIKLVESGIHQPILVLRNVLPEEMPALLDAGLIPSINCISLAREANLYGHFKNTKIKVHIRMDTATDGDGIPFTECDDFFNRISDMKWLEVEGMYTHLTSAYGQDHETVYQQLANFKSTVDSAGQRGIHIPLLHAASSPAIFGYPDSHFNMVRAGTVLYGVPFVNDDWIRGLKPVMQLKSRVVCIKEFKNGCSPGYGMDHSEQKKVCIAYVSIGYADAPFLLEAKNLHVLIGGEMAPVYGHAYMDHIKVDISHLNHVKAGDQVVIFGKQGDKSIGALKVASACGISKINCESICFFGNRVARVFTANKALPGAYPSDSTTLTGGVR